MKQLLLTFLSCLMMTTLSSQGIIGDWEGNPIIQGITLPIIFHFSAADGGLKGTMDSPKQGAFGLPLSSVTFKDGQLVVKAPNFGLEYKAALKEDQLEGILTQGPMKIDLLMKRMEKQENAPTEETLVRPQDPQPPFPYGIEEVTYPNAAAGGIKFAGTLTYPKDTPNPPVVILISGSGPQNRDSEIMNHRPFWVWADHLSRQGIAVLRYDERGIAESEGNFATATSADFASDVVAAIEFLRGKEGFKKSKIALAGHSEGGIVAPMAAQGRDDISAIVLLAGPGVAINDMMYLQNVKYAEGQGMDDFSKKIFLDNQKAVFQLVKESKKLDDEKMKDALFKFYEDRNGGINLRNNEQIKGAVAQFSAPWMRFFLSYEPAPALEQLQCPVLAINGDKDVQVVAEQNLPGIEKALEKGENSDYTIKTFKDLNHLFQKAETGLLEEYSVIEETVNPAVLEYVSMWLLERML